MPSGIGFVAHGGCSRGANAMSVPAPTLEREGVAALTSGNVPAGGDGLAGALRPLAVRSTDSILIECGEVQVAQDAAHDWAVRGVEVANVVQESPTDARRGVADDVERGTVEGLVVALE